MGYKHRRHLQESIPMIVYNMDAETVSNLNHILKFGVQF